MARIVFDYQTEGSNIFPRIKRPRMTIDIYSSVLRQWIEIGDVLPDTGADVSILPYTLGAVIVGHVNQGKRYKIHGMVSSTYMYLHDLTVRISDRKIRATFAISLSDEVPPTLGRVKALDKFRVVFDRGKLIIFS